jgi:hypothetical protein
MVCSFRQMVDEDLRLVIDDDFTVTTDGGMGGALFPGGGAP